MQIDITYWKIFNESKSIINNNYDLDDKTFT